MAKKWPNLLKNWCKVDKIMNVNYGYPVTLNKRLRIFSTIFASLALLDFILAICSHYSVTNEKYSQNYTTELYYRDNFPYYFQHLPYNLTFGLIISVRNKLYN